MRGVLIFDHLNDVLFTKCNEKFAKHVEKLAKSQGLIPAKVRLRFSFLRFLFHNDYQCFHLCLFRKMLIAMS